MIFHLEDGVGGKKMSARRTTV